MTARCEEQVRNDMKTVQEDTWERKGDHPGAEQRKIVTIYQAAWLLNFCFVKQYQLSLADVGLLSDHFLFITEEVIKKLVAEKGEYHLAAPDVDADYDLWELWRDSETRLLHWYDVANDTALIQPSSAFMEQDFSILRACMDEMQESSFSASIAVSALLKYNRGRRIGVRRAGKTGKRCHGVCFVFCFDFRLFISCVFALSAFKYQHLRY